MKFALVNPAWTYEGSTYFGCQDPHYPLELLFAEQQVRAAGHEPLLIDAHLDGLDTREVRARLDRFRPDFLVIPSAPSSRATIHGGDGPSPIRSSKDCPRCGQKAAR